MTVCQLVTRELAYRKWNFLLAVLAVAMAATTYLLTSALLKSTDLTTAALVSRKVLDTERAMLRLEDEMRKAMKGLGFNIYIFPEDQDLGEVYDKGFASKTMPETYVEKLANSSIITVNHLLPALTQKLTWPEQKRSIILIGIRGEVPLAHRNPLEPLIDPVASGQIVLGCELHQGPGFKPGDKLSLMGRDFTIAKCHPQRGSKDDITAWVNLSDAQQLLDKQGLINEIQALECNCVTVDRLAEVRKDLLAILPGTRIIEIGSQALARAEARLQAGATAAQQLAAVKAQRSELRTQRETLAALLLPLIALMGLLAVVVLALLNVRERLAEIGVFLALGIQSTTLLGVFLLRALVSGVTGGVLGAALALLSIAVCRERLFDGHPFAALLDRSELAWLLVSMPVFAASAAWVPSFWASRRDPAEVLRHD